MLINGDSRNNVLTGTNLADTINGLGGNDTLYGLGGEDALDGGAGEDKLRGGALADVLLGGANDDELFGEDGNDRLFGGTGTDLIDGGAGNDTALYTVNTTALAVNLALGRVSFPGQTWPTERLVSIENIETGSGNDTVVGSAVANVITTNAGNDTVRGGGGNDTLIGGLGQDHLYGEAGNDTLQGGGGRDYINGGSGNDTVAYPSSFHPNLPGDPEPVPPLDPWHVTVNLATGTASFRDYPAYGVETLASIENVTTGTGNDILIGNGAANVLRPGGGENLVRAGGGNDTIHGSNTSGFDRAWSGGSPPVGQEYFGEYLDGGDGNDVIHSGGSWNDFDTGAFFNLQPGYEIILGGAGNDRIHMGFGDLQVTGGSGADQFRFSDALVEGEELRFFAERASILDYNRGGGDRIVIDVGDPSDYTFVTSTPDAVHEWGFTREDADVVARINVADAQDFDPFQPSRMIAIEIRLANYGGTVTEADFHFI